MWCGGAHETREPHVTIGRTVNKSETTKNLPAFQDLNGTSGRFGDQLITRWYSIIVHLEISPIYKFDHNLNFSLG